MDILAHKFEFSYELIHKTANQSTAMFIKEVISHCFVNFIRNPSHDFLWQAITKVANKQGEIGIGQLEIGSYLQYQLDYLPPMFVKELILATGNPKQTISYMTLVHPFDDYVWIFTMTSTFVILATLILLNQMGNFNMQHQVSTKDMFKGQTLFLYSNVAPGGMTNPFQLWRGLQKDGVSSSTVWISRVDVTPEMEKRATLACAARSAHCSISIATTPPIHSVYNGNFSVSHLLKSYSIRMKTVLITELH